MREKKNKGKTNRKTYRKPKLEQVQLVVEEAVLEGCKTGQSGYGGGCRPRNTGCDKAGARS